MHVDASRRLAPLAVTRDAQLIEVCEASEPLLRAAREVIDRLSDQLVDSGYVIVLTNAAGCILKIVGDRAIQRRLARIDFVAGGDWSEAAAGTNAIGTALNDRRAVQLLAAEHFCDGWTNLTCTAVPIRDPQSGEVIGVLDLTGDYRLIRVHLTNLLAISVLEIEDRLRRLHDATTPNPPTAAVSEGHLARVRAEDDVFLTFASGAIGASLDLAATLRAVAEQTEAVLKVPSTAVLLFTDDGTSTGKFVWSQSAVSRNDELARTLEGCDAIAVLRERGEAILADDVANSSCFGERVAAGPFGSIALLPLPTARGTIGIVAAARHEAAPWNFVDMRRALALMAGAATSIENARLFEALRQHNRHIETINATAKILSEVLDPADHLDEILQAIVGALGYDAAVLHLRSREYAGLQPVATCGAVCGESSQPACGESHLTVALSAGTTTLGKLELCSGTQAPATRGDRATITAVAQQLAMALNNAHLLRAAGEVDVLRRADRLKSDFLATVSHDLRSPLTAICAGIDGILERPPGTPRDDGYLHTIRNQADRLGRLVDRLLDISQIERGALRLNCEWHDFQSVLDDVVRGIEPLYGMSRIVINIPEPHPLLFVDRDRFVQLFHNLIDNACKYSGASSPVTVTATWTSRAITIGITDRGPGFLANECDQIFTRFYRGERTRHNAARSIGIGLAICRGIVEAHGGTIWLAESSSSGSTFRFRIPLRTDFGRELPSAV